MGYLEETLIFESNKIYFTDETFGGDREVMMDWEDSLMSASAANVTIISNNWYNVKDNLSTYDGIFYDTFGDQDMNKFSSSLSSLVKEGAKVTWWNNEPSETNFYNIPNVTYQTLNVNPPTNHYFNSTIYYLPKKQF